jgi:hypothetical protein
MKKILSNGNTNAKTKKNVRETAILYLAPFTQNSLGRNLCPKASPGCIESCLFTSGRGAFQNVQTARINRTELFLSDRHSFLQQIANEINLAASKIKGQQLAVRLNGTSDVKLVEMMTSAHTIADNVVFYDYTKIVQKAGDRTLPSGHRYVVSFSRSETNEKEAVDVLIKGGIVAVVFDELPNEWYGFKVIDGDERDDLMLDCGESIVLGLKAKGRARKDVSGFVVKINN